MEEELNAKKFDALSLHVKVDNTPAINFYKKNGYFIVKELQGYYNIDDKIYSAYIMKKRLENYTRRYGSKFDEEKVMKIGGKSDRITSLLLILLLVLLFVIIVAYILYTLTKER
jgi:hypothetical protein